MTAHYETAEERPKLHRSFAEYKSVAYNWITLATGEYYPDILPFACELYKPVLVMFGQLLKTSESSERLLRQINEVRHKVDEGSIVACVPEVC